MITDHRSPITDHHCQGMQALRNNGMAALMWESLSKIRVSLPRRLYYYWMLYESDARRASPFLRSGL